MKKKSEEDYLDKLVNSANDDNEELVEKEYTTNNLQKQQKELGSEDVLDALFSGAKNMEFDMNEKKTENNPMNSRRVSKSEVDFLKEFEAELEGEADDFSDLFAEFEVGVESNNKLESKDVQEAKSEEHFTLGDVDLAALVSEASDVMANVKETPSKTNAFAKEEMSEKTSSLQEFAMATDPIPMDEIPEDMFDELFSGEGGLNLADSEPIGAGSSEGIDLGNLGEEDLMNLLASTDDLADIGNMLSQGEITEIPMDEMDAFTMFAENEMSAQQTLADPAVTIEEEETGKKKAKKGNLIEKLKGFFSNLLKDDEDEVALKAGQAPTVEVLSSENADILAELEALEEKPSKKEKKKKEKKKKEKKPKKAKAPKKPKAPKEPKPKKEKKPKVVDNTPPLPKGPVIMIWLMVGSLVALVLLGINLISYNNALANAKDLQNQGLYAEAFTELNGLKIEEKDLEMYGQLAILATVDSEMNAYEVFVNAEVADKAFDSLICAAGRCYINEEDADVYGCLGQLEIMRKTVSNELEAKYDMTYEEAIEMYKIRHRDDYTIALYKKLTELGIEWD